MAEALQAQAKLRQQDGDFDQAIGLAREALTILQETSHPRSREVTFSCFLTLATSHRDKGKLQVAASLFRRMIQRYQDQPEYRGQVEKEYADLLGNLGKSEQEAEALARGVDMKTDPVR
jgi:tetratricopeptide (TPR) repeat protein